MDSCKPEKHYKKLNIGTSKLNQRQDKQEMDNDCENKGKRIPYTVDEVEGMLPPSITQTEETYEKKRRDEDAISSDSVDNTILLWSSDDEAFVKRSNESTFSVEHGASFFCSGEQTYLGANAPPMSEEWSLMTTSKFYEKKEESAKINRHWSTEIKEPFWQTQLCIGCLENSSSSSSMTSTRMRGSTFEDTENMTTNSFSHDKQPSRKEQISETVKNQAKKITRMIGDDEMLVEKHHAACKLRSIKPKPNEMVIFNKQKEDSHEEIEGERNNSLSSFALRSKENSKIHQMKKKDYIEKDCERYKLRLAAINTMENASEPIMINGEKIEKSLDRFSQTSSASGCIESTKKTDIDSKKKTDESGDMYIFKSIALRSEKNDSKMTSECVSKEIAKQSPIGNLKRSDIIGATYSLRSAAVKSKENTRMLAIGNGNNGKKIGAKYNLRSAALKSKEITKKLAIGNIKNSDKSGPKSILRSAAIKSKRNAILHGRQMKIKKRESILLSKINQGEHQNKKEQLNLHRNSSSENRVDLDRESTHSSVNDEIVIFKPSLVAQCKQVEDDKNWKNKSTCPLSSPTCGSTLQKKIEGGVMRVGSIELVNDTKAKKRRLENGSLSKASERPKKQVKPDQKVLLVQFLYTIDVVCTENDENTWSIEMLKNVLMDSYQVRQSELGDRLPVRKVRAALSRMSKGIIRRLCIAEMVEEESEIINLLMKIVLVILCTTKVKQSVFTDELLDALFKFSTSICVNNHFNEKIPANLIESLSQTTLQHFIPNRIVTVICLVNIQQCIFSPNETMFDLYSDLLIEILIKYKDVRMDVLETFLNRSYQCWADRIESKVFLNVTVSKHRPSSNKSISAVTAILLMLIQTNNEPNAITNESFTQSLQSPNNNNQECFEAVKMAISFLCARCFSEQWSKANRSKI